MFVGRLINTLRSSDPALINRDVLRAKFHKMARTILTEERIEKLIEAVDRLETYDDAAQLIPLVVK